MPRCRRLPRSGRGQVVWALGTGLQRRSELLRLSTRQLPMAQRLHMSRAQRLHMSRAAAARVQGTHQARLVVWARGMGLRRQAELLRLSRRLLPTAQQVRMQRHERPAAASALRWQTAGPHLPCRRPTPGDQAAPRLQQGNAQCWLPAVRPAR